MIQAMHAHLLPLVLLAGCAGAPMPADELARLDLDDLVAEACSPAAREPEYARHDASYRPAIIHELAQRLGWQPADVRRVTARQVWVGATREQVLAAWGRPWSTLRQVSRAGELQVWTYGRPVGPQSFVELLAERCISVTSYDR